MMSKIDKAECYYDPILLTGEPKVVVPRHKEVAGAATHESMNGLSC